jgi:hypothetical protein
VDRAGALEQSVRQRRFAVIDVRDNAEVARKLNSHGSGHYAGTAARGQLVHSGLPGPFRNIFRNFAPRFPEKNDESNRGEVCNSVSGGFFCVLIAHIRGFTAAFSDQARATIRKHRR